MYRILLLKDWNRHDKGLEVTVDNEKGRELLKNGTGELIRTDDPKYKPAKKKQD